MSGRTRLIGDSRWRVVLGTAILWSLSSSACYAFQTLHGGIDARRRPVLSLSMSLSGSEDDPAILAIRSLASYHEGQWTGRARSFTVTPDVAAGVVKRKLSPEYTVAVKLATSDITIDPSTLAEPDLGTISLSETVSWGDKISHRLIPLVESPGASSSKKQQGPGSGDVDVDDVDGSYSVDLTSPKDFPSVLTGLSGKKKQRKRAICCGALYCRRRRSPVPLLCGVWTRRLVVARRHIGRKTSDRCQKEE